ncbi:MAG: hypothetical protein GY928_00305 [Colwellia sp.]|nr:hypothetical protein [Colwellia sp.]
MTTCPDCEALREIMCQLLTLLDQIEIEEDASLAGQRLKILEQYGEVSYTSTASTAKN